MIYAYMRYSSENQTGGVSIEMQRDAIKRYIEITPELRGLSLVERIDEAKSATTLEGRTALAAIRSEAKRGDFVVVFKLDRLARNLYQALQVLKDLEEKGVRVMSTAEPDMPLIRHVMLAMAEEFSRQLSDRCKRALDGIARSGHVTNHAPFGYRIERVGSRAKLVPHSENAAIIQRIFKMRASGLSHREIVAILNSEHVVSPRDTAWAASCVHNMLKNPAYRGTIISGIRKFKKGQGLVGRRPRSDWIICEGAHEPLVDETTWNAVRALDSNKSNGHVKSTKSRSKHLWTGFLKCSMCGANLVVNRSSGKVYYGCQSGRDRGQPLACQRRYLLNVDEIMTKVLHALMKELYSEQWVKHSVGKLRAEIERLRSSVEDVLGPLKQAASRLDKQIESAERRLVHLPEDSLPICLEELKKLKAERDDIKIKIRVAQDTGTQVFDLDKLEQHVLEQISDLPATLASTDVLRARELLSQFVEKIEISPTKEARLYTRALFLWLCMERVNIPTGI